MNIGKRDHSCRSCGKTFWVRSKSMETWNRSHVLHVIKPLEAEDTWVSIRNKTYLNQDFYWLRPSHVIVKIVIKEYWRKANLKNIRNNITGFFINFVARNVTLSIVWISWKYMCFSNMSLNIPGLIFTSSAIVTNFGTMFQQKFFSQIVKLPGSSHDEASWSIVFALRVWKLRSSWGQP